MAILIIFTLEALLWKTFDFYDHIWGDSDPLPINVGHGGQNRVRTDIFFVPKFIALLISVINHPILLSNIRNKSKFLLINEKTRNCYNSNNAKQINTVVQSRRSRTEL